MSFFGELRRRNVFRVGIAYLAAVWLVLQVADVVLPNIGAPAWIIQVVIFSCAMGLPVALIFAWFYEWTAEGIRAETELGATRAVNLKGRRLDFAIIGLLVLAISFLLVDDFVLNGQNAALPNSVAVLPLENLSADPDNAYFAAGFHEAILNELAKIRAMNVIARTSVLPYVDGTTPIAEVARQLNVETVMEGSIQYAGDRVLVTAQLIDPETNAHLWSDSYNRDFSDVFAIQADIAMNIANALEAEFSASEQESFEKIPTESIEAYALYFRALSTPSRESRRAALDQAIALDPEFALAYARRAVMGQGRLIGVVANTSPDEALAAERSVIADAERALELDPTLGGPHATLGTVHQANWRGAEAEREFQRALELSPNDVRVLVGYGEFKRLRGDYDESVRLMQRASQLDPNAVLPRNELALTYRAAADWDAAAEIFQDIANREPARLGTVGLNVNWGSVEAGRGNAVEAVRRLQLAEQLAPLPAYRLASMAHTYALAGHSEDAARLFVEFEEQATQARIGDGWWALAYVAVRDYEQALQRIESAVSTPGVTSDQVALLALAANPWRDPGLDTPEFRALFDNLWIDE